MFQRDHIVRQLRQFSQVLAEVMFRKRNQEYDAALAEIQRAGEQFFGLDSGRFRALTSDDFLAALGGEASFNAEAAAFLAELLRLQGELLGLRGEAPGPSFEQALLLYLDAFDHDPVFRSPDTLARIDAVLEQAGPLSAPALSRLFPYFEAVGRYDRAEDTLFRLAERGDVDCYDDGLAFFERLRRLSFTKLRRGGLPLKEVEEGLRAFRRQFGP